MSMYSGLVQGLTTAEQVNRQRQQDRERAALLERQRADAERQRAIQDRQLARQDEDRALQAEQRTQATTERMRANRIGEQERVRSHARQDEELEARRAERRTKAEREGLKDIVSDLSIYGQVQPATLKRVNSGGDIKVKDASLDETGENILWTLGDDSQKAVPMVNALRLFGMAPRTATAKPPNAMAQAASTSSLGRFVIGAYADPDPESMRPLVPDQYREKFGSTLVNDDGSVSALDLAAKEMFTVPAAQVNAILSAVQGRAATGKAGDKPPTIKDRLDAVQMLAEVTDVTRDPVYTGAARDYLRSLVPGAQNDEANLDQTIAERAPVYVREYARLLSGKGIFNNPGIDPKESKKLDRIWLDQGMQEEDLPLAPHRRQQPSLQQGALAAAQAGFVPGPQRRQQDTGARAMRKTAQQDAAVSAPPTTPAGRAGVTDQQLDGLIDFLAH